MDTATLVDGMFWFLAFLFSTTVHEAAHAWLALRGGDKTAYLGGQVSLSPVPHIRREPIGMVVVPLITAFTQGWSLGWASTPYDPLWAARHPRRAALMSLAGPAGNFTIAILAWIALRVGLSTGYFEFPASALSPSQLVVHAGGAMNSAGAFLAKGLSVLVTLNVLLGFFNLLPLPPMDGASAVVGLLPRGDTTDRIVALMNNPMFSLVGLIVAWQIFPKIAQPLIRMLVSSLYLWGR